MSLYVYGFHQLYPDSEHLAPSTGTVSTYKKSNMSELELLYSNKSIMLTNVVILAMRVTTSFNSVTVVSHVFTERDPNFFSVL